MKTRTSSSWLKILAIVGALIGGILLVTSKGCAGGGSVLTDLLRSGASDPVARVDTVVLRDTLTRTVRDTVFEYQDRIVYLDRIVPSAPDTVFVDVVTRDTVREYTGTRSDSTVEIGYAAYVTGTLDSLDLSYLLTAPRTITFRDTIFQNIIERVEVTKTVRRSGFYVGAGITYGYSPNTRDNAFVPNFGAGYMTKRGRFLNYSFTPSINTHTLTARLRVF